MLANGDVLMAYSWRPEVGGSARLVSVRVTPQGTVKRRLVARAANSWFFNPQSATSRRGERALIFGVSGDQDQLRAAVLPARPAVFRSRAVGIGSDAQQAYLAGAANGTTFLLDASYGQPERVLFRPAGRRFGRARALRRGTDLFNPAVAVSGHGTALLTSRNPNRLELRAGRSARALNRVVRVGCRRCEADAEEPIAPVAIDDRGRAAAVWADGNRIRLARYR